MLFMRAVHSSSRKISPFSRTTSVCHNAGWLMHWLNELPLSTHTHTALTVTAGAVHPQLHYQHALATPPTHLLSCMHAFLTSSIEPHTWQNWLLLQGMSCPPMSMSTRGFMLMQACSTAHHSTAQHSDRVGGGGLMVGSRVLVVHVWQ
jgi:hypothetical protein